MKGLRIYVTTNPYDAHLKVIFVKRLRDEFAQEIIANADRVQYRSQADSIVYITRDKAEAHIAMLPDRFPRMKKTIPRY